MLFVWTSDCLVSTNLSELGISSITLFLLLFPVFRFRMRHFSFHQARIYKYFGGTVKSFFTVCKRLQQLLPFIWWAFLLPQLLWGHVGKVPGFGPTYCRRPTPRWLTQD